MKNICHGIIIESKRILLIKRSKDKRNFANFWAFPGGGQELNETPEETTIREVKEEVGLDFEIERLFSQKIEEERWLFVDYLGKAKGIINLQTEECDGYGWFTYKETKYLPIGDGIQEVIKKLYNENLIN